MAMVTARRECSERVVHDDGGGSKDHSGTGGERIVHVGSGEIAGRMSMRKAAARE